MNIKEKESILPVSPSQLDEFIAGIIKDYRLPRGDDTVEAIATQILHLDNRIGRVKRSYFADCAVKYLANKAAFEKLEAFKDKRIAAAKEIVDKALPPDAKPQV
jgi:hypothetical protein